MTTWPKKLCGLSCDAVQAVEYEKPANEDIYSVGTSLRLADGTRIEAQFWRLIRTGMPLLSIFDHRQQYGLPAPIDALGALRDELVGKKIVEAVLEETTGDLQFRFDGDVTLQIFNFTSYEIWQVLFPDGAMELSNYARAK